MISSLGNFTLLLSLCFSILQIVIFGKKNLIDNNFLNKYSDTISIVNCEEIISDNDKPSSILRSKKESSMRKAIEFIKSKKTI